MFKLSVWKRKLAPWGKWLKLISLIGAIGLISLIGAIGIKKIWGVAGNLLARPLNTISILADPTGTLGSIDGRTNILIMGKGGEGHEGADLTDTMMVASLRLDDRKVSMIPIPRDIWIDSIKAKINTAYYYGQQKNFDGGGITLAKDAIYQVTGLPIQYVMVVNFDGFERAIDLVGGIDLDVERSFTDEKYPIERVDWSKPAGENEQIYETVSFEKGKQQMNGKTALKFARSRYSTDLTEGTDFARSQRQQKVLMALAEKIKSRETALNLNRVKELRDIFNQYTETNLKDEELLALGRLGMKVKIADIQQIKVDEGSKDEPGLLINPPVSRYGQWVLAPRTGSWESVKEYIKQELEK